MDSISSPELARIFERVSTTIDMQLAFDSAEIEARLEIARDRCKNKAKKAKNMITRQRSAYLAEQYDKLIEKNFADRVIFEANKDPRGIIFLTLFYGRAEAKRILAQRRARARMAYPRVGVRYPPARKEYPRRRIYERPRGWRR